MKYEITTAEAAGDYEEGLYDQNGEADFRVLKIGGSYRIPKEGFDKWIRDEP